ncbi:MAG: hypothetical protein LBS73_00430 [Campylobacteraceae bacterium]|nr:hypothetical protein [Campylobacteraceae bacterium]
MSSKPSTWFNKKRFLILISLVLLLLIFVIYSLLGGSERKDITGFSFESGVVKEALIIGTDINVTIDYYSADLTPNVTHTGVSYTPSGAIDFEAMPVTYTITAEDGTEKDYSVNVKRAFTVAAETELANAIDTITNVTANYITIFITNDITLSGKNRRTIPSAWAGRHITLENNSTSPDVTIKGLTVANDAAVGLIGVNIMKIASIKTGRSFSLALTNNGKLWASGDNNHGQLGLGNTNNQASFQNVAFEGLDSDVKIASISASSVHSLALDDEGRVWAAGNNFGQLGLGNTNNQNSFQLVTISNLTLGTKIVSIAAGKFHSLALDSEGRVWASGVNDDGQLGLGNTNNQTSFQPVTISGLSPNAKIISISAGSRHSLALDSEGRVWATGYNYYGQLGLDNTSNQNSFKSVTFKGLTSGIKIASISAGNLHSLALTSNGRVWASGWNNGLLGLGNIIAQASFQPVAIAALSSNAKITSISAGDYHSLILTNNGTVYSAGASGAGQLGLGNVTNQISFQPTLIKGLSSGAKIASISAGGGHSLVLDSEGKVYSSGANEAGQLGLGDSNSTRYFSFTPVTF